MTFYLFAITTILLKYKQNFCKANYIIIAYKNNLDNNIFRLEKDIQIISISKYSNIKYLYHQYSKNKAKLYII